MRCLTYLLLLPETLKKSKKVGQLPGSSSSRLPLCYEVLTLSLNKKNQEKKKLKKKMAAELYPATDNTNLSTGTTVPDTDKPPGGGEVQLSPGGGGSSAGGSAATTPTTLQNISNNNNLEPRTWQSSHPTLRER